MTKTRNLEKNNTPPGDNPAGKEVSIGPEQESPVKSAPTATPKQAFVLVPEVRNALIAYLSTKPLNEVEQLVSLMRQAEIVNLYPNG